METCKAGSPSSWTSPCLCIQGLKMLKSRGGHHLHQRVREAKRALKCALETKPRDPGTLPTRGSQCFQSTVGGRRLGSCRDLLYLESILSPAHQPSTGGKRQHHRPSNLLGMAHAPVFSHCIFLTQWGSSAIHMPPHQQDSVEAVSKLPDL
jgi:hypothetical protein